MKDLYEILGVPKNASQDEIKKAFRKLAHQHHPDKKGGDTQKFKEINAAYQVLSDEEKRSKYDQYGSAAFEQGAAGGSAGGFSWEDIMRQGGTQGFDMGDINDIFGEMFGFGGRQRSGQARGSDIQIQIQLEFREAVFGVKKEIKLTKTVTCAHCSGNGAEPGTKIVQCDVCKGKGQVASLKRTIFGSIQTASMCTACHGSGKKAEKPCKQCHGMGIVKQESRIDVQIPAGIDEGETIRLSGQGEAGQHGAHAGDLYVTVRVKKDARFVRKRSDLLLTVPLKMAQAALGDTLTIDSLDGPVSLKISPGTQSGTVFRLASLGVPLLQKEGRGSLYVTVQIQTPKHLSKKQREYFEELKKEGL